jgi:peptidoglycan L-alanyl-D-glutamate endopeptidase CwlK
MNAISEARLDLVNPALAEKIRTLATILSLDPQPITLVVSAGLRTWAAQDALYAQGRSTVGNIVTNAPGGHSWHNFGCAVDCEPEVKDGTIDWNSAHPQWIRMEQAGESLGLVSGATWVRLVDAPHFQLTGRFPEGAPDDEARQVYSSEGAAAFWAEVNAS